MSCNGVNHRWWPLELLTNIPGLPLFPSMETCTWGSPEGISSRDQFWLMTWELPGIPFTL
jgi:hypothetical protein